MSRIISIYFVAVLMVVGSACRPLYRASIPNQPVMKEKHTLDMEVGLETGTGYFNASYSLTDHFFLTAGGNAWSSRHTSAQFGEFGLGVYSFNEDRGLGTSLTATSGFGFSNVIREEITDDPIFGFGQTLLTEYSSQFARFALQPGVYWQDENTDISMALRTSGVYWLAPEEYEGQSTEGMGIYAEPVVSLRTGSDMTKFFFDASLQIPLSRPFNHPVNPIHLGVGMSFIISKRTLEEIRKVERNEQ